jgi:pyruvate formate lyase activating enzyme
MSVALSPVFSSQDLAARAGANVTCVCYFGGDPSPQMPHAIGTSELAIEMASNRDRMIRICWETNGAMNEQLAVRAAQLSLSSGGNVKFDLKFASDELNRALCSVSNKSTLKNFELIGRLHSKRPEVPLISASTLLVPGYVDSMEIEKIASIIAKVDARIPYSLLAFYPHYVMNDLPTTNRKMAMLCLESARKQGLENVRLRNVHLLS